jgi:nitrite reductase (NADH) large subunit
MRHLIIGNGVAGVSGAISIRKLDDTADITIITAESFPFYSRIRLIDYLANKASESDLIIFKQDWYEKKGILVHLSTAVVSIDIQKKAALCSNGTSYPYDQLLVATGGVPTIPPISGIQQDFVCTLRSLADAQKIKRLSQQCENILVLGGGLLGIETAHALVQHGRNVTVLEFFPRLLPRQMDDDGARMLQSLLEQRGLRFVLNAQANRIVNAPDQRGIELSDGRFIAGDMIIVSAGITPQTSLLDNLPITKRRGVQVNDRLEVGIPCIYAAGDLIEHRNVVYGIWAAAESQGKIAGANMAGADERYEGTVPSNILKVAGIELLSAGNIDPEKKHRSVIEIDQEKGIYRKLVLEGETLVGCILCGNTKGRKELLDAIQQKRRINDVQRSLHLLNEH